jgi:hypothetical protein
MGWLFLLDRILHIGDVFVLSVYYFFVLRCHCVTSVFLFLLAVWGGYKQQTQGGSSENICMSDSL